MRRQHNSRPTSLAKGKNAPLLTVLHAQMYILTGLLALRVQMHRTAYFDLLNVLACISVITLHCNSYTHSFAHNTAWMQSVFFETFFYPAVPIFFMLSGATLLNYRTRYTTKIFLQKRFKKTLLPYIFFTTFFFLLSYIKASLSEPSTFDIHGLFSSLFTGHVRYAHYWFFIPLFIFYLFAPFLEKIASHSQTTELIELSIIVFFFQMVVPLINLFGNFEITQSTAIYGFSIFALWGFALHNSNLEKNKILLILLGILALFSYIIRYWAIVNSSEHTQILFNYFGFYSIIPTTFLFLLAKSANSYLANHPFFCNKLVQLSSCSFGIYLLHGFIIACLPFDDASLFRRTVCVPIVYICSMTCTIILKRIKFLSWMVP